MPPGTLLVKIIRAENLRNLDQWGRRMDVYADVTLHGSKKSTVVVENGHRHPQWPAGGDSSPLSMVVPTSVAEDDPRLLFITVMRNNRLSAPDYISETSIDYTPLLSNSSHSFHQSTTQWYPLFVVRESKKAPGTLKSTPDGRIQVSLTYNPPECKDFEVVYASTKDSSESTEPIDFESRSTANIFQESQKHMRYPSASSISSPEMKLIASRPLPPTPPLQSAKQSATEAPDRRASNPGPAHLTALPPLPPRSRRNSASDASLLENQSFVPPPLPPVPPQVVHIQYNQYYTYQQPGPGATSQPQGVPLPLRPPETMVPIQAAAGNYQQYAVQPCFSNIQGYAQPLQHPQPQYVPTYLLPQPQPQPQPQYMQQMYSFQQKTPQTLQQTQEQQQNVQQRRDQQGNAPFRPRK